MTKTKEILEFLVKNSRKSTNWYLDRKSYLFTDTDNFFKFLEMIEEVDFQAKIVKYSDPFLKFSIIWKDREINAYPSISDKSLQELI